MFIFVFYYLSLNTHIMKVRKFDYIKANRKGSREAELENQTGWSAKDKVHKSSRTYSRKEKYKKSYCDFS